MNPRVAVLCVASRRGHQTVLPVLRRCISRPQPRPSLLLNPTGLSWRSNSVQLYSTDPRNSLDAAPGEASSKHESDPLRILFCGSDEFSSVALEALVTEKSTNPDLIESIDVVVRPGKRTGRGYKTIRHPPIRSLAERLGLPVNERDTFTGWTPPAGTNLIIAVSFGLFVPPRLLFAAKYGGLNLHPSLLPCLRGPAPLPHTLLSSNRLTGVTLQTLHHERFDHGVILAQTPASEHDPGALVIPRDITTVPQLRDLVSPIAAAMLVRGLRDGVHIPPLVHRGWAPVDVASAEATHAPKLTKRDSQLTQSLLNRISQTHAELNRSRGNESKATRLDGSRRPLDLSLAFHHDAIGPLWFWTPDPRDHTPPHKYGKPKRVIIEELEVDESIVEPFDKLDDHAMDTLQQGENRDRRLTLPLLESPDVISDSCRSTTDTDSINITPRLVFQVTPSDDVFLGSCKITRLKLEGDKSRPAIAVLRRLSTK
ncbi:Formyltransferase [Xylariaceae sp. FL0016]|nr:Formyltransferase [Xylariaceae sp. FL0016]